ncbi:PQQ-binding-like beta-propeller repeat protein [Kitasatospora sp. NPDC006697]|uniref:outer membrane protein assembly factor BamB family protein n=1 Tax=Kitasatospora sp. NPDC006697 TaxID=3364020 RepID=UPI0036B11CC8
MRHSVRHDHPAYCQARGSPVAADTVPMSVRHDAVSGLWTLSAPPGTMGAPVVSADRVYLPVDGRVTALDRATGRVLWQTPHRVEFHSDYVSAVFAVGEHLVVPDALAYMTKGDMISFAVLSAATGGLCWSREPELVSGYSAHGRTLVFWRLDQEERGTITAVDLATGGLRWRLDLDALRAVLPTDDRVVASTAAEGKREVRAYDLCSGEQVWRSEEHGWPESLRLSERGPSAEPVVLAWNWLGKQLRWFSPATGERLGSLVVRPRISFYSSDDPLVRADGESLWLTTNDQRRIDRLRPFAARLRTRTFTPLPRRLAHSSPEFVEAAGWLYAMAHPAFERRDTPWEERRGTLVVAARVNRPGRYRRLTPVRWPEAVPRGEREVMWGELAAGRNHAYVHGWHRDGTGRTIALRGNRVLWRREGRPCLAVPVDDQVLLVDTGTEHDRLSLIDGETGACAGPPAERN